MTEARLFADYLREIEKGRLHQELSVKFQELVQAVAESGRAGKLSLVVDVKPFKKSGEAVELNTMIKLSAPQPERDAQLYFITPEFNLSRRDPRQGDIEEQLHTIDGGRAGA
jgi:hypothetical protein